jgi:hypothetical protein
MSDVELEPVEARSPKVAEPAPVQAPAPPEVTRRSGGALFDTGMGAGMGSPSPPTLMRHLARRPPEDRKAGVDDLNGRVGNRQVTRMIMRWGDVGEPPPALSNADALAAAIQSKDVSDIKAVHDFSSATSAQRVEFIGILVNQGWVGPMDEYALERLWNSFGDGIVDVVTNSSDLWNLCVEAGMDPSNVPALNALRTAFENDVKALARAYMQRNLEFADQEMAKLGVNGQGSESPTAATEQAIALEEVQELARGAEELLKAKDQMLTMHVGYKTVMDPRAGGATTKVLFDPDPMKKPTSTEASFFQRETNPPAVHTWDQVKEQWDAADASLAGIGAKNPTVFAAIASGREEVHGLGSENPQQAKQTASRVLTTLRANIVATIPKLDTGDLDWRDLQPIHQQLYGGRVAPSGTPWNEQVPKSIGEDVIGDHESTQFWISLGLGTAAAALFIVAEIATGGLATAALLGGLAVSGGQAVASWENYEDLSTAAAGTASEETRLVSQGQVDAALIQAVLDTIFAALDFGQAVRVGRGIAAGMRMEAALAANGAEAALEAGMRAGGPEAAAAIERSIAELGAEATARKTGKTVDELLALLPAASPARARLIEARQLIEAAAAAGTEAGAAGTRVAMAAGNAAEEAWKNGRALGELVRDVPGAIGAGTISREFGDKIVSEAIESLGPAEALKRAGGWRSLQQALTNESAAGRKLMQWRNSVFSDLERYVTRDLEGQIQRTGTSVDFSNDIDMSFIGPNASEVRDAASQYLARRLGVDNSPQAFDRLMMAGLFTDPRRMHAYDGLPGAMRDAIARTQAAKQEQLIWNRRLWEAAQHNDENLARQIRTEMSGMGIPEFAYRPLSEGDIGRLARRIDSLHGELETAVRNGDAAAQARLAEEIGDSQALINAAEGGGYFSGGGVRRYVSERPGETPFPRLEGGAGQVIPRAERITAIIDQLPKLDHGMLQLAGSTEEVVAGIRSIGKYGKRLFEVTGDAGLFHDGIWEALATRCTALKRAADAGASTMSHAEAAALAAEARSAFAELTSKSSEALAQLRAGANIPNVGNAMEAIQNMTIAHTRLLRATEATMRHVNTLVRAIDLGMRASDLEATNGQPGDQRRPDNASYPDQNQSVDPSLARTVARTPMLMRSEVGVAGKSPVHEIETLVAVRTAIERINKEGGKPGGLLGGADVSGGNVPALEATKVDFDPTKAHPSLQQFIRGVVFPDDPQGQFFSDPKSTQQGPVGAIGFGANYVAPGSLTQRSHEGDLQFFHGMATKEREKPQVTKEKILEWSAFLTELATGRLDPKGKVSSHPVASKLFPQQADQTFGQLFGYEKGADQEIRQRAAGALMHLIQDSHATGHTERNEAGQVKEFHSYTKQDHEAHGKGDKFAEGKNLGAKIKATPGMERAIEKCAVVLVMLDRGAPTAEVMKYLDEEVLALSGDARRAGPGHGMEAKSKFETYPDKW